MEEIEKQVQQFRKDYEDGDAIAQRYLKIVNLPDYLTRDQAFHKRGGSHSKSNKHTHDRQTCPTFRARFKSDRSNRRRKMPRFLEIRIIGHPDDVEQFVNAVKATNNLGADSVNYPTNDGQKVRRYIDIVIPGLSHPKPNGKK